MMTVYPKRVYLYLEGQDGIVEVEGRDVDPVTHKATWGPGFFGRKVMVRGAAADYVGIPTKCRDLFEEVRPGVFREHYNSLQGGKFSYTENEPIIVLTGKLIDYEDPYTGKDR